MLEKHHHWPKCGLLKFYDSTQWFLLTLVLLCEFLKFCEGVLLKQNLVVGI